MIVEQEDLFSVLENKIESLLSISEQNDEKICLLEEDIRKKAVSLSEMEAELTDHTDRLKDYGTLKKFLAFSIKDNYILSMKNMQTRERIKQLLNKLDSALKK